MNLRNLKGPKITYGTKVIKKNLRKEKSNLAKKSFLRPESNVG